MEWISVKDKLPSRYCRCIVNVHEHDYGNFVMEAEFLDGEFQSNGMVPIANLVTHWMPLPEPPNTQEE